jgi:putative transposase
MARGDGGKPIFSDKEDCLSFMHWLDHACQSHGWRVHAWVLMGNHFHLLLETPEPNLSIGMRLLLGSFSQAWNLRRQRRGHVFQGRYKAVPVAGERAADAYYFKSVADYIHLNPARAGLVGGERGKLVDYPWSSLRNYPKGNAPDWQPLERVLDAFHLSHDRRGRSAYVNWLESRAKNEGGQIDESAMEAIRRGWYLGEESFRDKLLGWIDQAGEKGIGKRESVAGGALREHGEKEAESLIREIGAKLGLPERPEDLALLRKGDPLKVICAALVKGRTAVTNDWLAKRLEMGHPAGMSGLVNRMRKEPERRNILKKYEEMLKTKD